AIGAPLERAALGSVRQHPPIGEGKTVADGEYRWRGASRLNNLDRADGGNGERNIRVGAQIALGRSYLVGTSVGEISKRQPVRCPFLWAAEVRKAWQQLPTKRKTRDDRTGCSKHWQRSAPERSLWRAEWLFDQKI